MRMGSVGDILEHAEMKRELDVCSFGWYGVGKHRTTFGYSRWSCGVKQVASTSVHRDRQRARQGTYRTLLR
jgi:hypothetical protein